MIGSGRFPFLRERGISITPAEGVLSYPFTQTTCRKVWTISTRSARAASSIGTPRVQALIGEPPVSIYSKPLMSFSCQQFLQLSYRAWTGRP